MLSKSSAPQKILEKKGQKGVLRRFLESLAKKNAFFPSKLAFFGAGGAFQKNLGSVGQKRIPK